MRRLVLLLALALGCASTAGRGAIVCPAGTEVFTFTSPLLDAAEAHQVGCQSGHTPEGPIVHGPIMIWSLSGQLIGLEFFDDGVMTGPIYEWFPDGALKSLVLIDPRDSTEVWYTWHQTGAPETVFHWETGELTAATWYNPEGELIRHRDFEKEPARRCEGGG